jgi:hypothetical protein
MSDTTIMAQRCTKTGRFLAGNSGGGRKPGSRNKLSEAFVADVQASWEKHGAEVLERVAREEPGTYLRVVAALMPKDVRLDVSVDPVGFAQNFRDAVRLLHETPGHVARPMKVINGG